MADDRPGRSCPLHYRYAPGVFRGAPAVQADTLYVAGGLYGNVPALQALVALVARYDPTARIVFNGDFNWFDVDDDGFERVNRGVLDHVALRGNVETELATDDAVAGCGCAYPEWVGDADVERSNRMLDRLRGTARRHPGLRARLGELPMHLVAEVAGVRIGIVHGDAHSLAGWSFSHEVLATAGGRARLRQSFEESGVRVFASSHTCLPVLAEVDGPGGRCALVNNGAAGMPNFRGTRHGVVTRLSTVPTNPALRQYGSRVGPLHVDALRLDFDHAAWMRMFSGNWPPGSPGHESYHERNVRGPNYDPWGAQQVAVA